MATGRNCSMLGINSGHHYLPTYQILMISDNADFLRYSGGFKIFEMFAILKMAAKIRYKKWAVKIQHCLISSKFDMLVDNDVPNWFPTLKNFYRIVAAILKMATGRNFAMSRINLGHHYLPTYQIVMISDNVDFLRYCGGHFENGDQ
jgi:hypothetical protein